MNKQYLSLAGVFVIGLAAGYGLFTWRANSTLYASKCVSPKNQMEHEEDGVIMEHQMKEMVNALEGKTGDAMDLEFLKQMIVHHQGAVMMAETLIKETKRPELQKMGKDIIEVQNKEIEQMEGWLTTWFEKVQVKNDPYGKAEAAFDEVTETIKPSGKLDPNQKDYTIEDRLTWYEKLQWAKDCEADFRLSSDKEQGGIAFYSLGNKQYLLRANCYLAAYQNTMIFMLVNTDGKNISGKMLPNKENNGQYLGFDSFDPKNQTLTIYYKARGVGDCGSRDTFRITNGELELIKTVAMSCEDADEFHLKNPNAETMPEWPVVFEKK